MATMLFFELALSLLLVVKAKPVEQFHATITAPAHLRRQTHASATQITVWDFRTFSNGSDYDTFYFPPDYVTSTSGSLFDVCQSGYSDWKSDCSQYFPTKCVSGTLHARDTSFACETTATCTTNTIYTAGTVDKASLMYVACAIGKPATWFMAQPTGSMSFPTSSSSNSPPSPTSRFSTVSQTSSASPSPTTTPSHAKQASKAWIAGAVIGPLALIAIVGLVLFLLKRKRNDGSYHIAPPMSTTTPQQQHGNGVLISPLPEYQDAKVDSAQTSKTSDNRVNQNPSTFSHDLPELVLPSQNRS